MERNIDIDIMKGIAILCVMLGHSSWVSNALLTVICSFHMPLFFLVSGYYQKTHEEVSASPGGGMFARMPSNYLFRMP